jgi:uncharacterized protein (TIGR02611 family)
MTNNHRQKLSVAYRSRRQRARATYSLDLAWRAAIFVIGGTLLGLGIFFLIFPGPGWATIWLGAAILASEFAWAQRLIVPLQRAADLLAARTQPLRERRRALLWVGFTFAAIFGLYVANFGLSIDGLFQLHRRVTDALGW